MKKNKVRPLLGAGSGAICGKTYFCQIQCKWDTGEPATRFKVEVMAQYSTRLITLLLWERDPKLLCGKPLDQVIKELPKADDDYLPSLNKMLERKMLIKIHETTTNGSNEVQGNVVNLMFDSDPQYNVEALDESVSTMEDKTPAKRASTSLSLSESTPLSL
ncbi:hypothetical protein PIB30_080760 [Stylosanthes scabra]|uniref:Uncharacterized protein n=1 Tax=Stylosanthes scabra TaxID=79078 RepID=A0ABU6QSS6_9FABA|nr:hypothetical protein [Stylosanthes scabra]